MGVFCLLREYRNYLINVKVRGRNPCLERRVTSWDEQEQALHDSQIRVAEEALESDTAMEGRQVNTSGLDLLSAFYLRLVCSYLALPGGCSTLSFLGARVTDPGLHAGSGNGSPPRNDVPPLT
jgi:hypothetical protein